MQFKNILSENSSSDILKRAMETGKMHHAYLLTGLEGSGKMACAVESAMALLCRTPDNNPCYTCSSCRRILSYNHPDFRIIFPFVSIEGFKDKAKKLNLK